MLKNYFTVALRNLMRHKLLSSIKIIGLAVGMASFVFVTLYVRYELSYDRFHAKPDRIFRINMTHDASEAGSVLANTVQSPLAETLKSECPGVDSVARLRNEFGSIPFQSGDKYFLEDGLFYSDPEFFNVFSFPLIAGDPGTALNAPYSIVLTEEMARKIFANENPIGKVLTVDQEHQQRPYLITGVLKKLPSNTHVRFNFLASFATLYAHRDAGKQAHSLHWNATGYYTYVRLKDKTLPQTFVTNMNELAKRHRGPQSGIRYSLEPIRRIHLHQNWDRDLDENGDIQQVYLFSAIGFFVFIIACFNYVNISTAQSIKRVKEVGLRKVIGADRRHLIHQFLFESLVTSFFGYCLSIGIVVFVSPLWQSFLGNKIPLDAFLNSGTLAILLGILLILGCLAGAFPAFHVSAFQPNDIFKGAIKGKTASIINLRKYLVVFQFAVSAALMICSIVVFDQLRYLKNKNLGMRKDHIVIVNVSDQHLQGNYGGYFSGLSSNPRILDVSASQSVFPGTSGASNIDWDGRKEGELSSMRGIRADRRFADLYEIQVIDGPKYSGRNQSSSKSYFLLNRAALKALGWKNAVGRRFQWNDTLKENGEIIGIVEDFNFYSLHRKIEPLAIELVGSSLKTWKVRYFSIKIDARDVPETLSFIEREWKKHTHYPFQMEFYDDRLNATYGLEQKVERLFVLFAFVAIGISSIGLYGLASFSIEQRVKEIGVRKALGASISQIVGQLSKEFSQGVLAANILSWPVAYFFLSRWLQKFAYRIDLTVLPFLIAGVTALSIALLTVGGKAFRAASANPVESLRYE